MNGHQVTAHTGLKDAFLFDNDNIPVAFCLNRKLLNSKIKIADS